MNKFIVHVLPNQESQCNLLDSQCIVVQNYSNKAIKVTIEPYGRKHQNIQDIYKTIKSGENNDK